MMIPPRQHPRHARLLLLATLLGASSLAQAFYMPASAPRSLSNTAAAPTAATRWSTTTTSARPRQQQQRRHGGRQVEMRLKFNPREDYYARLGIERTASVNDIKRAYRRLALQTHPDVNKEPNAAETFKKVCEAYKVLSDADTRRQYDMMRGGAGTSSGGGGGAGRSSWGAGAAGAGASSGSSRQWYDQYDPTGFSARRPGEETADSIDDSFSSIFRDLVGSVAVRGSKGVLEDFVEFLEQSVDGFGDESDAGFEEVLGSEDLEEVQKECESIQFLLNKLREKLQKAKMELLVLEGKLRVVQSPAAARDMAAVDKRLELVEQTAAMRARVQDLDGHIKRADRRQRRLMTRAEELRWGTPGGVRSAYSKYANPGVKGSASTRFNTAGSSSSGNASSSSSSAGASSSSSSSGYGAGTGAKSSSSSVEEELQKLKKQMGL